MKILIRAAVVGLIALLMLWQVMLAQATATVVRDANLRAGPGTTFAIVGGVKAAEVVTIIGGNAAGDWYQLEGGQWIAAFLVEGASGEIGQVTPAPSATATAVPVGDARLEQAYADELAPIMKQYSAAIETFGEQMLATGNDPSLILDEQWRLKMATALATWNILGNQMRAIKPPARYVAMHNEILSAAAHYERAGTLIVSGLDQFDGDKIDQGNTAAILGSEALGRAVIQLQSVPTLTPTAPATSAATKPAAGTPVRSTPAATPTPTVSKAPQTLKPALMTALGESNRDLERVASVTVDGDALTIQWAIDDSLSDDWLKDGIKSDVVSILQVVWKSKLPFKTIHLAGTFAMQDRFGNVTEDIVVDLTYGSDIVRQINWGDALFVAVDLPDNIYDLAEYKFIHLEFR